MITYEQWKEKYAGAKTNPATGLYWQSPAVAKVEGVPVDLIEGYAKRYQAEMGAGNPDLAVNQPGQPKVSGFVAELKALLRKYGY